MSSDNNTVEINDINKKSIEYDTLYNKNIITIKTNSPIKNRQIPNSYLRLRQRSLTSLLCKSKIVQDKIVPEIELK